MNAAPAIDLFMPSFSYNFFKTISFLNLLNFWLQ
jgi:hypothetical protein